MPPLLRSFLLAGFSLSAFPLFASNPAIADGPFAPDWAALNTRQPAAWFADALAALYRKAGALYATVLAIPREEILIRSLATESVSSVRLLGSDTPPVWHQSPEGLRITPPSSWLCEYTVLFKIDLARL